MDGRTCQHDRDVGKDQAMIPYLPIAFCLFFHRYNTMVNRETEVNLILAGIINQLFFRIQRNIYLIRFGSAMEN